MQNCKYSLCIYQSNGRCMRTEKVGIDELGHCDAAVQTTITLEILQILKKVTRSSLKDADTP